MEQKMVMKRKGVEGEIVRVEGGHILRSTSLKDRHSKVYTAKGPRDRRVRLSAQTAIQFYDVQDRLGYDRPSKAVDWLMEKAKYAIDKLELSTQSSSSGTNMVNINQTESSSSYMNNFQNFADQMMSSTTTPFDNFHAEGDHEDRELGLSLQSFQDQNSSNPGPSGSGFEDWGNSTETRVGFVTHAMPQQAFFNSQMDLPFPHREFLQSNNYSNFINQRSSTVHQSSDSSGVHFAFGFQVPARLNGDDESETQN